MQPRLQEGRGRIAATLQNSQSLFGMCKTIPRVDYARLVFVIDTL